jgi:hypothetical protein
MPVPSQVQGDSPVGEREPVQLVFPLARLATIAVQEEDGPLGMVWSNVYRGQMDLRLYGDL